MSLFLDVPYKEKDEAKALGAKWNPNLKKWYLDDRKKYKQCLKWINANKIICNQLYIVESQQKCFRCGKQIQVIGFAFETFYEIDDDYIEYWNKDIHVGYIYSQLPPILSEELKKRYNYFWGYSKTTDSYYYGNHCQNSLCNVLQGNWFLFYEDNSPFFVKDPESASKLILHKIHLPNDITIKADIGYGSADYYIKQNAIILESDLKWE